jgi:hypothetical protein
VRQRSPKYIVSALSCYLAILSCYHGVHVYSCPCLRPCNSCIEIARDGQRYFVFPELKKCCRCCSWSAGCGPVEQPWTTNAVYKGRKSIKGEECDNFQIQGYSENHLYQTLDGKRLCELDNGGWDYFFFEKSSFSNNVDPSFFDLPADAGCDEPCGCPLKSIIGHCDCALAGH